MSFSERDWSALEAEKILMVCHGRDQWGPWPSIMENYGGLGEIIPVLHVRYEFLKPF